MKEAARQVAWFILGSIFLLYLILGFMFMGFMVLLPFVFGAIVVGIMSLFTTNSKTNNDKKPASASMKFRNNLEDVDVIAIARAEGILPKDDPEIDKERGEITTVLIKTLLETNPQELNKALSRLTPAQRQELLKYLAEQPNGNDSSQ